MKNGTALIGAGFLSSFAAKPVEPQEKCKVYVLPGDYTVGTLQLKDNVNLNLEAGAALLMSQDTADFIQSSRSMIFAQDVKKVAVTGRGILNGLAKYEFVEMQGIDPEITTEIEIARKTGVDMRRSPCCSEASADSSVPLKRTHQYKSKFFQYG